MNPVMTLSDAAKFLGCSARKLYREVMDLDLPTCKQGMQLCFSYPVSRQIFQLKLAPKIIALQIVKGGTGKTSLALNIAARANLYGLKVLCIDMDQQGNLTSSLGVDAEQLPVMVDILAEGYKYSEAIVNVIPGLDLLASRIENALLDEVIHLKKTSLDKVYAEDFAKLKSNYDVIIIDCPPNLGQSVASLALAADTVVAPVILENYALSGLRATKSAIKDLAQSFNKELQLLTVVNKFKTDSGLSNEARVVLANCRHRINESLEFPRAVSENGTIFDNARSTTAKTQVDSLVRELLGIDNYAATRKNALQFGALYSEDYR